jgi:hypothetical protein
MLERVVVSGMGVIALIGARSSSGRATDAVILVSRKWSAKGASPFFTKPAAHFTDFDCMPFSIRT